MTTIEHGYSAYSNGGCRCDICKSANAQHSRDYRELRRHYPPDRIPHGYNGYHNYACRCLICRAGNAQRGREYRAELRARKVTAS